MQGVDNGALSAIDLALERWRRIISGEMFVCKIVDQCDLCHHYGEPTEISLFGRWRRQCPTCILARIGHGCLMPGTHMQMHCILVEHGLFCSQARLRDLDVIIADQLTPLIGAMLGHLEEAKAQLLKEQVGEAVMERKRIRNDKR